MKEFVTQKSDLSNRIGALELSDEQRIDDDSLAAAGAYGTCIEDRALESAGFAAAGPTTPCRATVPCTQVWQRCLGRSGPNLVPSLLPEPARSLHRR
jgi:hypothetical protein